MAFLGLHSISTLLDAFRDGWHPVKDDRKPCAKFAE
jgi:hypothetical protein